MRPNDKLWEPRKASYAELRKIRRWQLSDDPKKQDMASESLQYMLQEDRERYLKICEKERR